MKNIASVVGVSVPTVSRTLSNAPGFVVSAKTKERIINAAQEMGFCYNAAAKSLRMQKTSCIGLFIPELDNPIYSQVCLGVQRAAHKLGYNIFISTPGVDSNNEKIFFNWIQERRVDGLLLGAGLAEEDVIRTMEKMGYPFVVYFMSRVTESYVAIDEERCLETIVDHLVSLGHKNIAYISGPLIRESFACRFQGYKKALASHGITYRPELVAEGGRSSWRDGYHSMQQIIGQMNKYTAIIGSTINISLGVLAALSEAGVRVPQDVSVIGMNDSPLAEISNPPLTVLRTPLVDMGSRAMYALHHRLQGKQITSTILPEAELVIRKSTAPPGERRIL